MDDSAENFGELLVGPDGRMIYVDANGNPWAKDAFGSPGFTPEEIDEMVERGDLVEKPPATC